MRMTASKVIEYFKELNPDEEVWVTWFTKAEVKEECAEMELTDSNDEPINTDPLVTDEFFARVTDSIDSADHVWDRFADEYRETCIELISKQVQQIEEDEELWDKE